MDPVGTSRNEQIPLLVLNHCPYRPGEEANNVSSYFPSMVVSAPNDHTTTPPLTRYGSPSFWQHLSASSLNRRIIFGYQQHAALRAVQPLPAKTCWPQLTDAVPLSLHCLRISAANRRCQSNPIVLHHSIHLIYNNAICDVDRCSYSFINTHVDTSALSQVQVPSLSPHQPHPPHQRHKHNQHNNHPTNSDTPTSTTSPAPPPPPSTTSQLPPGDRPVLSGEVISAATQACVDPGFIFVAVGLCWLIVCVGEGATSYIAFTTHVGESGRLIDVDGPVGAKARQVGSYRRLARRRKVR